MLLDGVKLLFSNWRLLLVQVVPAMWIWVAMIDLKAHVLHGKSFHVLRGPVLIPLVLAVVVITAASFFLNAVFGFVIVQPGPPRSGRRSHRPERIGGRSSSRARLSASPSACRRWSSPAGEARGSRSR